MRRVEHQHYLPSAHILLALVIYDAKNFCLYRRKRTYIVNSEEKKLNCESIVDVCCVDAWVQLNDVLMAFFNSSFIVSSTRCELLFEPERRGSRLGLSVY